MFLAAVRIWIGFRRNLLSRGALALLERVWIGAHDFVFPCDFDLAAFCGDVPGLASCSAMRSWEARP
jgi:hypothetical protein